VFRCRVQRMCFVVAVATAAGVPHALAQTNIDQGKSSAEIFATDCGVCHKTTRGLANGQNSLSLSIFLKEHYTASSQQASALAAYVLGAGGNAPAPPGQKPGAVRATAEEPKTSGPKTGDAKTAATPPHPPAKHDDAPIAARPERPKDEEAKGEPAPPAAAAQKPTVATPAVASRTEKQESEPTPSGPVSVPPAVAPVVGGTPVTTSVPDPDLNPAPSATTAGESQPGDSASVPRDNIPD
jgi:hypothetical protein